MRGESFRFQKVAFIFPGAVTDLLSKYIINYNLFMAAHDKGHSKTD